MNKYKVALFDVDGVLIIPPRLFSEQYCEHYNVDPVTQGQFYATKEFKDASTGKYDLIDAIRLHNDKWQWDGDPEELMKMWFDSESSPNDELLGVIDDLRKGQTGVYLATQQEKYRKQYLMEQVFDDKFDGIFCTCDIGYGKHEEYYWAAVLKQLMSIYPDVKPEQIVYFDDRQSLVDMAAVFGIDAHLYNDAAEVRRIVIS